MQEKEALIGIYDDKGNLIGKKLRKDIDKKRDILKTINILIFNNRDEVFMINARDSVFNQTWGGSCAGLVRYGEDIDYAAKRTLVRELGLDINVKLVKEQYYNWNGIKRHLVVFNSILNKNPKINLNDFKEGKWIPLSEAGEMIKREECMPSFVAAFESFGDKLR